MPKNVVIIDDDAACLEIVSASIGFVHPNHAVTKILVRFGTDVMKLVPDWVDVFLVDSDMGVTTGPEVIRLLAGKYPTARIIGWSADLTPEKAEAFLEAGATEVTNKKSLVEEIAGLVG